MKPIKISVQVKNLHAVNSPCVMKTIKTLMLMCIVTLFAISGTAQNYYAPNKVINGNGFTYICHKKRGALYTLCNQQNVWTFKPRTMKDGSPIRYEGIEIGAEPEPWISTDELATKMFESFKSCLTPADQQLVKGDVLILSIYINSDTGMVTEVDFEFLPSDKWAYLAPEKYYAIEQAFKKNLKFTITAEGKKFNYNICSVPVKIPKNWK
jgi:hypothetical protein